MNKYLRGIIAGFVATIFLSLLMLAKQALNILPEYSFIRDMSLLMGTTSNMVGWILHFVLGAVLWGLLFARFVHLFRGRMWVRGLLYGIAIWFAMMIIFMPLAGNGFCASGLGSGVATLALFLHISYGIVLAVVYGWLPEKKVEETR